MKQTQINAIKRIINNNPYRSALQGIFTDATAYRSAINTKNGAIFFNSPFGDGLLMPIRKT